MASTTVNFNLKTAGYVNFANQTLTFTLLNAGAEAATGDQSYVTLPGTVTATSAANGDGSVSLFRNGKSGIDSVYEVVFPNRERAKFIIPAGSSTIELAALLVDNVPGGASTQQSSVYAEAIKRANHTGTQALSTISDAEEGVEDIVGGMLTGNTETGITVTYQDADGTIDFVVASQTANDFTNTLKTKLDAIEADVTTLSLPASTTITDFAKTFLDDTNATAVKNTLEVQEANILATTTLGYKVGSGGTATQASNKTTAVTLNSINGEIIMNAAALADDATAAFTLTNSTIAATDVVIVNVASVGTAGAYQVTVGAVAAGSCSISVLNVSGGSLSEAIKLNFAVIKAVKS